MAELGALVKNYLDEPLNFYVKKRNGATIRGELKPNSYVDLMNMSVGDDLHVWNDRYAARETFRHPRNSKYIIAYPHAKRDVYFMHRGYHPIIVTDLQRIRPTPQPESTKKEKEKEEEDKDHKIFILAIIFIFVLGVALFAAILTMSNRQYRTVGSGVLESPIENIQAPILI